MRFSNLFFSNSLLVLVALLLPLSVQAADTQNLMDIYQQALSRDPVLASARSGNVAAQEKLEQGKALFRPTVSLNANASHSEANIKYNGISIFRDGRQSFENYGLGVNVTQPIYRQQNNAQFEQAKRLVTQADKQLALAQQDLMIRTAQAYFDELLAQDKIDLIGAQKIAISQQLEQAKANFDAGNSTITDVNEAQARFDLTQAQEIAAINELEVKKRAIQSITGESPKHLAELNANFSASMTEQNEMESWVNIAEQNSLQLNIQQQNVEIATQEVTRQHAVNLPTLDAVGGYSTAYANGSVNGFGNDLQNAVIGLELQMPLYQGGAITSKIREAVANQQKAQDDLETVRRQTALNAREAYLNLASSVAQVKAYEQALISSQSQLDSSNLGYQVGVRTSVDVLNAQQQLFSAKRDLLQARYTNLLSSLRLKLSAGLLSDADMVSANQQLSN